jgi:RimJ/RimL family protein N-acetyltransferase
MMAPAGQSIYARSGARGASLRAVSEGTPPRGRMNLVTERLTLRPFTLEDAPFILRLLNEPSFIENIADKGVRTLEHAEEYLKTGPLHSYEVHGHGLCRVALRDSDTPVGMCGLLKRDTLADVDLGYAFLPEFTGRGLALEAARATVAWAAQTLGLGKLVAIVAPANTRSIALLRRLGFANEGTVVMPGDPKELLLEGLLLGGA